MADYYVDGAVGNDANAGTAEGAGNAWATIQKAMDTVAKGDTVYVKASATYAEDVIVRASCCGNLAADLQTFFIGYTSTPGDNGRVTMTPTTTAFNTTTENCGHLLLANFHIDGAAGVGVGSATVGRSYCSIYNCVFSNCGTGIMLGAYCTAYKNKIYGNTNNNNIAINMMTASNLIANTCFNNRVGNNYSGGASGTNLYYKNVSLDCYWHFSGGGGSHFVGNLCANPAGGTSTRECSADNYASFVDNICVSTTSQYAIYGASYPISILNNIVYDHTGVNPTIYPFNVNQRWSGWGHPALVDLLGGDEDEDLTYLDVGFTDPASGDWTLTATSVAVNNGAEAYAPVVV